MVGSLKDWSQLHELAKKLQDLFLNEEEPPQPSSSFDKAKRRATRAFRFALAEEVILNLVATVTGKHVRFIGTVRLFLANRSVKDFFEPMR